MADPEIPVTPAQVDTSAVVPNPAPQGQGPIAPPPGTPGVAPGPAGTPQAPNVSNLPAARPVTPPAPSPQQIENVKHNLVGRAFSAIAGPQDQKPGQIFRSILAATILGGAAGAGQRGFGEGMNAGFKAQQEQQQQLQQQKRQAAEDQQKAQAAQDEHQLHQASVAHANLSQILLQKQIDKMDADQQKELSDSRKAILDVYAGAEGAQPVAFNLGDGKPSSQIPATQFMQQTTANPALLHPTDAKNYERHFVAITPDGSVEKANYVGTHWEDADTGKPLNLADHTMIQAYDIPTASFKKPVMTDGSKLQKMYPALKDRWQSGTLYPVTPEQADAMVTANSNALYKQAQIDDINAQRREREALARKSAEAEKKGVPQGDTNKTGAEYLNTLPPAEKAIVNDIGIGRAVPERISYLLSRNPALLSEVALAFPDIDTAKLEQYQKTYQDYTSGRTFRAIQAGGTAFNHLSELQDYNTPSARIQGTQDYVRYQNKLDTVATELASFYAQGNAPTKEAVADLKKTLGTLTFRDEAIRTQAESMSDKMDNYEQGWQNAAPSKAYEAPMPGLSDKAKQDRAKLDPRYRTRIEQPKPLTNVYKNPQTGQTIGWDGSQYVDANTRKPLGQ